MIDNSKSGGRRVMTPYWTSPDGRHVLYCGDNVAVMSGFPAASIDLVVTSPPYDNLRTYSAGKSMADLWNFEAVAQQLWRIIKPGGVVVWVVADATIDGSETGTSFRQALRFMEIGFRLHDTMIYMKDAPQFPESVRYGQVAEYMFVLSHGQPKAINLISDRLNVSYGRTVTGTNRNPDGTMRPAACHGQAIPRYGDRFNVWTISNTKGNGVAGHPAQFPEALARDHILSWSNKGDIVLDPFNGSGTTAKMAMAMGRKSIGIELSREYCDIAVKRMERELSQPNLPGLEPEKAEQGTMFEGGYEAGIFGSGGCDTRA